MITLSFTFTKSHL